ncbi:glycosyltransferase family protein [Pontibacter cellulosilyticus]|uniref:Uncharacterized protein n=1 Tax=Pontibacter cellulosilyticus TaxID=1720253 RepID=A0A923N3R6_9BACT|nr:hypothetical protein [Pontibacter cellulosilyticus]MBC5991624.1 hypothetical protein [Pontibacter cellulosilyticus]
MKSNLIILHYSPVEFYPPILNLLDVLNEDGGFRVSVITTYHGVKQLDTKASTNNIKIYRLPYPKHNEIKLSRLLKYAIYYLIALGLIIWERPRTMLYYESISSLPALLYKRFRHGVRVFAHYHEYTSQKQYQEEMKLVQFAHRIEKLNYNLLEWISHTNTVRLDKFAEENNIFNKDVLHVMPNYPPKKWLSKSRRTAINPFKLVYVGSLDLENMYFEQVCEWVEEQDGNFTLDVFSYNYKDSVQTYLNKLKPKFIRLMKGVDYYKIPSILAGYNAGLILYRGHSFNYIYNAPNKLFEYLACGLDVWFPEELKGSHSYIKENSVPKVLKLNFKELKLVNAVDLVSRNNLPFIETNYNAEDVYKEIISFFKQSSITPL